MSVDERVKIILEELYSRGSKPRKKIDLRVLALLSLALSIAGLAIIVALGQTASAPLAQISDVYGNFLMNYATVRLQGKVVSMPYVDNSTGRLTIRFEINDGTGSILLYIYQPVSITVLKQGKIPLPGDFVETEAQIRVRETFTYGIIQAADVLHISKIEGEPLTVSKLSPSMAETLVKVEGILKSSRVVGSGILLYIDTGEDTVDILVPNFIQFIDPQKYADILATLPGSVVEVKGVVYLYKGTSPEIVVRYPTDIFIKSKMEVVKATLANLEEFEGKSIEVEATIKTIDYLSETRSYKLVISDSTGEAEAIADRNIMSKLDPFKAFSGSVLVKGMVKNGVVNVAELSPLSEWDGKTVKVSEITEDMDGQLVVVKGKVEELVVRNSFSIFYINDGSGRIKVFVPGSVFVEIKNLVKESSAVTLAGYVDIYKGELEIVVFTPLGVKA